MKKNEWVRKIKRKMNKWKNEEGKKGMEDHPNISYSVIRNVVTYQSPTPNKSTMNAPIFRIVRL